MNSHSEPVAEATGRWRPETGPVVWSWLLSYLVALTTAFVVVGEITQSRFDFGTYLWAVGFLGVYTFVIGLCPLAIVYRLRVPPSMGGRLSAISSLPHHDT